MRRSVPKVRMAESRRYRRWEGKTERQKSDFVKMLFGNGLTVPLFVLVQKWHLGEGLSYRRRGHFTESQVHCLWITLEMESHGRHGCTSQRSEFKAKCWTYDIRSNRLFHRSQKRGGKQKTNLFAHCRVCRQTAEYEGMDEKGQN